MFMATRRRRRFLRILPGLGALFFVLFGFFAMQDDELPNQGTWKAIFWGALVVFIVFAVFAILTPERTKKRLELDALPPVPSQMASWYYEHRKAGNAKIPFYFVAIASAEDVYLSREIVKGSMTALHELQEEQHVVPLIENKFSKGLTKSLNKMPRDEVVSIKSVFENAFVLTDVHGQEHRYQLSAKVQIEEVVTAVANLVMPGVVPTRVTEQFDAGVVRKKTVDHVSLTFDRSA